MENNNANQGGTERVKFSKKLLYFLLGFLGTYFIFSLFVVYYGMGLPHGFLMGILLFFVSVIVKYFFRKGIIKYIFSGILWASISLILMPFIALLVIGFTGGSLFSL